MHILKNIPPGKEYQPVLFGYGKCGTREDKREYHVMEQRRKRN
jgi:hypothetical protein